MPQATANLKMVMHVNPQSAVSEVYRTLRFNLDCLLKQQGLKTVAVTSANPGEGKTTTAMNLAVAAAQTGRKILLIDADMRKPAIHQAFKTERSVGLSNYLSNRISARDIIRESYVEHLYLIASGNLAPNPAEILASDRLKALLDEMKTQFDLILVDTPASLSLTDARIVSSQTDGVLLVVEHGKLKRRAAQKMNEDLTNMKANLLGIVFNKLNEREAKTYLS